MSAYSSDTKMPVQFDYIKPLQSSNLQTSNRFLLPIEFVSSSFLGRLWRLVFLG